MTAHSEVFRHIEQLVPSLGGWSVPEKVCEFAAIIVGLRPRVSVEIGTWEGRGAFGMALAHRFINHGKTYVVDPWSAAASIDGQGEADKNWWGRQEIHDGAYVRFTTMMETLQLGPWLDVQRATSEQAKIPEGIGLLVLDGNHGEQAVKDVDRWAPHIGAGGILYLDDLNWSGGAVTAAGNRAMELGFIPLYQRDQGMFYQRAR